MSLRRAGALAAASWGIGGLIAVLCFAVARLSLVVADGLALEMTPWQWLLLSANVAFLAWSEGYRGFQKRFSPRTAARTRHLYDNPTFLRALLAPLFVTGYFGAGRRTQIGVWVGTAAIIVLILLVHRLDQPLRGIIDAGVVVGLSWGILSLFHCTRLACAGRLTADPDVPNAQSASEAEATSVAR